MTSAKAVRRWANRSGSASCGKWWPTGHTSISACGNAWAYQVRSVGSIGLAKSAR